MRKIFCLLLCLCLLVPLGASAAEPPKYIALTFEGGPNGLTTRALLAGLAVRNVRATFFLRGSRMAENPELTEQILAGKHEIGIQCYSATQWKGLSRRDIAAEINGTRALLPQRCPVRLLAPPERHRSDAAVQVARAMGLSLVDRAWSLGEDARSGSAAGAGTLLSKLRDGDILLLDDSSHTAVNASLNLVDILLRNGFTPVTVSELARLRGIRLKPGASYSRLPPAFLHEKLKNLGADN